MYKPLYYERYDEKYETLLNYDTPDIYCVPVKTVDGAVAGILQLLNRTRPFTQGDYEFLKPLPAKSAPF